MRAVTVADDRVRTGLALLAGSDVTAEGAEVAGGEVVRLAVELNCDGRDGPEHPPVRVTVRTPVGLERARTVGVVALPPPCGALGEPG